MRKLILTMAAVGALAVLPLPVPADATPAVCDVVGAVNSCDADFPSSSSETLIAIRGWCYLIRWCLF